MIGRTITDHSSPLDVVGGDNGPVADLGPVMLPAIEVPPAVRGASVSGLGIFAAIGAAALCLAFSPKVNSSTFTPKFAVMLLFAAVGIVPLARLARRRSRLCWTARAAIAFLAVALVSALVSPSPNIGFFGLYLWGSGWLLWLGAAGAFAIGASLSRVDRQWLFAGLLVGAVGNALIAVFQIVKNLPTAGLSLFDGKQADGLLGNPVFLEALLLGALALVLGRTCRSPLRWGAVVVLLAVGLEFTFERYAIAVLILMVLYALYTYGVRRGGSFALLVGAGFGIAYLRGGSGLGARVTSGTGETTFGVRLRIWLQSAHYVLHHPLLGVGPGQFRTAMDSTATLSFFQNVLAGKILTDGHDIFVSVAVTTGLLGLACFLIWVVGAARSSARSSFLGFALALFAVELVEPINVAILPLAFLSLGAATAVRLRPGLTADSAESRYVLSDQSRPVDDRPESEPAHRSYSRITTVVAVTLALFLGATMVTGDVYMLRGTNFRLGQPFNVAAAMDANNLLPYWPDSALEVAQIRAYDSLNAVSANPAILAESRHWTSVATSRDSRNPQIWTLLAGANVELGSYAAAHSDYVRALSCDKWYTEALEGLGHLAGLDRNWSAAVHWYQLALKTLVKDKSEAAPLQSLLRATERHLTPGNN